MGVSPPILLLALALLLSGCSEVAYYWQAGLGQLEILRKRRPIEEVLEDPAVAEATKAKLRLVRRAQAFGREELALPEGASFHFYTDLERDFVSWLVVASEPYAFRAFRNCFPVVGCLGYRGFFQRADANGFASGLEGEGLDVWVRPVSAYSTLGWFDDPVLNTTLRAADLQIVATVLHEQAHQVLFVKGDTAFNESFATFVEREGVPRFLRDGGGQSGSQEDAQLARYEALHEDRQRFRAILLRGKARLEGLYGSGKPTAEMVAEKTRLFAQMRQDYQNEKGSFKLASYDSWFAQDLNNAHLVGVEQYQSWVGAFQALFDRSGQDFARFYDAAKELADMTPEARRTRLQTLANEPVVSQLEN